MGRKRSKNPHLPDGVHPSNGWHFWRDPASGRWHKLGREWDRAAKERWIELSTGKSTQGTVAELLDNFLVHREHQVRLGKISKNTYEGHLFEIVPLKLVFGRMHYNAITGKHIASYLRRRTYTAKRKGPDGTTIELPARPAPVRANREIALLSSAYSWAMGEDAYEITGNPCYGVRRNKETPKDRCPERWEIEAAKAKAPPLWQQIFDLAYVCGQRGIDIRMMPKQAVQEDGIRITQTKAGSQIMIEWDEDLRAIVAAILAATRAVEARLKIVSPYLIVNRFGQPYTATGWKGLVYRFVRAAIADESNPLSEPFSFHDIRAKSATDEEESGTNPQFRLGHKKRSQTDDYVRSKKVHRVKPLPLKRA